VFVIAWPDGGTCLTGTASAALTLLRRGGLRLVEGDAAAIVEVQELERANVAAALADQREGVIEVRVVTNTTGSGQKP
jgi:hypothetical protein